MLYELSVINIWKSGCSNNFPKLLKLWKYKHTTEPSDPTLDSQTDTQSQPSHSTWSQEELGGLKAIPLFVSAHGS